MMFEGENKSGGKSIPEFGRVHSHSFYIQKLFLVDFKSEGISAKTAYERYESYLISKELIPLDCRYFGRLLAEVFPEKHMVTKKRRVAVPGTQIRECYYENLKIRSDDQQLDEQSNNKTPLEDMVNKAQEQKLVPDKWFCTLSTSGAEYVRLENSTKVLGKLTISQSLEWKFVVSGIEVKKEYFSDINKVQERVISSAKDLQAVLNACDELTYCSGCTNPEYCILPKNTFNSKGGQSGVTEEISNGQEIKRSTDCQIIILPKSRSFMCSGCQQLKSVLNVALNRTKTRADTPQPENVSVISSTKNWKYLTEEQQKGKQFDERRRRRNSEKREKYTKRRLLVEREMIKLELKDSEDVQEMFSQLDKGSDADGEELTFNDSMEWTEEAAFFWKLQRDVCTSGRPVWHPRFLEVCLRLWERTKEGYEELRDAGFMKLPSGRHLRYIKNKVVQKPGINKQQLDWMVDEKEKKKVTTVGCNGYLVFDEMAIQGDLQLRKDGDCFELAGLVRLGELHETIKLLQTGKHEAAMASHILQFTFVGCEGFQFPVAYYPTDTVDPVTLFHLYWEIVGIIVLQGFFVHLGVCDGAQANRAFILAHFEDEKDAIEKGFTTINPYTGGRHTFMMDPPVSKYNLLVLMSSQVLYF